MTTRSTSAFFGPWDEASFLSPLLHALDAGEAFAAPADSRVSPTYTPHLVDAALDLLLDGEHGLWHLANRGGISWFDFACLAASLSGRPSHRILPAATSEIWSGRPSRRHGAGEHSRSGDAVTRARTGIVDRGARTRASVSRKENMRVAVTGGAGYIGSVVTEVLGADGHQVLVIDNLSKGHQDGVAGAFEQIDLRDRTAVAIALRGFRADAVIHMAASSLVGESVSGPLQWTPRHQALDTIVGSAWAWMKRADPAVAAVQGRQSS